MSHLKCCVPGCDVASGLGIPLHRFPNPNKKNTLFMNWIKCVGGDLSTLDANYVFKNRRVCSRHFDSVYIYPPSNRLCSLAVPALFLPMEELNTEAVLEVPVQIVRKEATTRTTGVYHCGKLSGECKDIADLLIFFDEVFDSVNGSYHQVQKGKVYRSALTPKSPHHGLWKKSIQVLKSMDFFDKAGRKVYLQFAVG